MIAAVPAPTNWPLLDVSPKGALGQLAAALADSIAKGPQHPLLDLRWNVGCMNPMFAVAILTPDVCAFIMSLPNDVTVRIAGGAVTLCRTSNIVAEGAAELVQWTASLRALIPLELDHWDPQSGR